MGDYKLIALDMDGTVLNDEQKISAGNRDAIREAAEAGVTVMFATGRGIQRTKPYVEELGLESPIVTVNGGEVWKSPQELHFRASLPAGVIRQLREIARKYDTWYWGYTLEGIYNRKQWAEEPEKATWLKFGFYYENGPVLAEIRAELESWGIFEITNSHPFNLEINPKGVNKASGVGRVCELLGIGFSQVVMMGDSLNDMALIRQAGLGIAMGNAQEELKQAADRITLTNNEDGVAYAIRHYVLKP